MRVLCNRLNPRLSSHSKECNGWLTIGKEYVVLSVYGRGDRLDYRIIGDDRFTPALQAASQFEIIDGNIPNDWMFRQYSDSEWVIMPAAWSADGFWVAYFDREASARAIFEQVVSIIFAKDQDRRSL